MCVALPKGNTLREVSITYVFWTNVIKGNAINAEPLTVFFQKILEYYTWSLPNPGSPHVLPLLLEYGGPPFPVCHMGEDFSRRRYQVSMVWHIPFGLSSDFEDFAKVFHEQVKHWLANGLLKGYQKYYIHIRCGTPFKEGCVSESVA